MSNYKITTLNAFEMFFSIFIIGSMFLPWMKMDMSFMGTSQTITKSMVDDTPPPIFYIICTLCIVNVIVKIFNRSLWLSFITAAFPLGYVIDMANNLHEIRSRMASETLSFGHVSLGAGAILSAALSAAILISVFCEWIFYMQEKASKSPREKYKRYFLLMGIGIIIAVITLLSMGFLPQLIAGEEISAATRGITSIMLVVIGVLGILMFIQYLLLALMTLAHHRKGNNTTQSEDVPASSKEEEEEITDNQEEATVTQKAIPENIQDSNTPEKSNRTILYAIGGIIAAAIIGIICFFAFGKSGNSNNPLGVQKPKWEKFVKVNAKGVMFFKEASTESPNLQIATERLDGCMPDEKMLWQGDKVPRGYDAENYGVEMNDVFPVMDENEDFYKVYIGTGEIREAYLQKKYSEDVKPEPITKEIIDKVKSKEEGILYRFIEKGEYSNLYLERYFDEMGNGETVKVGTLVDGSIVLPKTCEFYPSETDTTGVEMKKENDYADHEIWKLVAPKSYWKKQFNFPDPLLDIKALEETDIQKIVTAVRPSGNTDSEVWYYFPTVTTDQFISFEYSFSPATTTNTEEAKAAVSNYRVEDDENLIATIDGEDRDVNLQIGKTQLFEVRDLDGDGSMEAIVSHYMTGINGEPVDCPFVVYYDAESDTFKKTEEMKLTLESIPTIETDGDNTTIRQREGLRTVRYSFKDKKLEVIEDKTKKYGHTVSKVKLDDVFGDDEGEKSHSLAFLDGEEAMLKFEREAGGYYHGYKMELVSVELPNGETKNINITANTFLILKETSNGMPEIIGDNFLYRWNEDGYEKYEWDGSEMVKAN